MNYKQLLILRLSNLTEWKNEKEMIIPEEMRDSFWCAETCEFLGDGKYILYRYYKNGQLHHRIEYQNNQLHGLYIGWYEDGSRRWQSEYQNNQLHGLSIGWYEDGDLLWKEEWKNGKLVRE